MLERELEILLAERAIAQNIIRFARAMDAHDWDTLRDILADDATAELGTGRLQGPDAIIALIRQFLDRCGTTQHLVGNIVVDVSGDTASSVAYVHDSHLPADNAGEVFYTLGDYHDRWHRQDGRWQLVERIKHNRATVGSLDRVFGF